MGFRAAFNPRHSGSRGRGPNPACKPLSGTGIFAPPAEAVVMLWFLTNALNAFLLFCVAAAPFLSRGGVGAKLWEFWLRSALGIGLAVILAESGKRLEVWPGHPGFPSGHETLALAAATCLVVRDRRWLWAVLPLALIQAVLLVIAHFHHPVEVAGALLTGPPPVLLCHLCRAKPRDVMP